MVPDGTPITVSAIKGLTSWLEPWGGINAQDIDPSTEGLQIGTNAGMIVFSFTCPDDSGVARVTAESPHGSAAGEYRLNVLWPSSPGDSDGDAAVDLADAILSLQVCAGMDPPVWVDKEADVNRDGRISTEEVVYILQGVAHMR